MMTTLVDLAPLEQAVEHALVTCDQRALHVLGYGEISCVLAWPDASGPWACKRLPVFDDPERLDTYRARFAEYVTALEQRGVTVQESRLEVVPATNGISVYIVQPSIAPAFMAPAVLRGASERDGRSLLSALIDRIVDVVSPTVGLDAQLSNWAQMDGELLYFDISTQLLRDGGGRDLLDTDLFIASLPAFLRPVVRHFLLGSILDQFFTPRGTALDLIANLYKEELGAWVPTAVDLANERLGTDEPLTVAEARRYYRRDARVWGMLQRMRRLDRVWQRRVRRRTYRFLLPGRINRRL